MTKINHTVIAHFSEDVEQRDTPPLFVEVQICTTTLEIHNEISKKKKNMSVASFFIIARK